MPITNSQIISTSVQADGSRLVHERHTDHNGLTHDCQYYAPVNWDIQAVLASRAANLSADIDLREAQEAEARNYHLSISPVDFIGRFSSTEWKGFEVLAGSDVDANYLWAMFSKSRSINTRDQRVIRGVNFLLGAGILSAERATEVLQ